MIKPGGHVKKFKICIINLISLSSLLLCSCNEKYISAGFYETIESKPMKIALKMASKFSVGEEIVGDLYYGHKENFDIRREIRSGLELVTFCIYFKDSVNFNIEDDYKNPENGFLIKEISSNSFLSEEYNVYSKKAKYDFSYHEDLLFDTENLKNFKNGVFDICLIAILVDSETGTFLCYDRCNCISLRYATSDEEIYFYEY